jgi:carbon storage regulator
MLVLTRKNSERVLIDGGIVVTVVRTGLFTTRLGFEAPPGINIIREELLDIPLDESRAVRPLVDKGKD